MKRFAVLLLAATMAAPLCMAQQPTSGPDAPPSEQEVLDFFKIMHIREQTLEVLRGTEEQVKTIMRDLTHERVPNITPGQLAQLDAMVAKLYENYPIDELLSDMVPVYRKHLTKADLDAVLAFYSTPIGQKLLHELPAMPRKPCRLPPPAWKRTPKTSCASCRSASLRFRRSKDRRARRQPKRQRPRLSRSEVHVQLMLAAMPKVSGAKAIAVSQADG